MFSPKYSSIKLKLNLNLCIERLKVLQKKYDNAGILKRKEVAEYLRNDKFDLAEIKTEIVVRDDYYREALEIIEMYCSLILTRSGLLDSKPQLDESLREPVYTLIWAAPRLSVDLREVNEVKKQLGLRFGKELMEEAANSEKRGVSDRIVRKLSVAVPPHAIVQGYMKAIASTYKVDWKAKWDKEVLGPHEDLINLQGDDSYGGGYDAGYGGGYGGGFGGGYTGDFSNGAAASGGGKGHFLADVLDEGLNDPNLAFPAPGQANGPYAGNPAAYPPQAMAQPPQRPQSMGAPPTYTSGAPQSAQQPLYPPTAPPKGGMYPPGPPAASGADVFPESPTRPGALSPEASVLDLPPVPQSAPMGRGQPPRGGGGGGHSQPSAPPSNPAGTASDTPGFDELAERLSKLRSRGN